MQYLKIKNSGLIDLGSLSLIGASTKDGISSIGQFGSGNKYALAYFLRNDHVVRIFRGKEEIKITLTETVLRDQTFQIINFNGIASSITTAMGKDWKCWQAIREFYSNALDEGDAEIKLTNRVTSKENETHFYISVNSELLSIIENFDCYFANDNNVIETIPGVGRILKKASENINLFRKGIKCYNSNKQSLYDYDIFNINVTEDRLVAYPWVIKERIYELISKCSNKEVIRNFILNSCKQDLIEYEATMLDFFHVDGASKEYLEVIKENVYVPKEQSGFEVDEELIKSVQIPSVFLNAHKHLLNKDNFSPAFRHMAEVNTAFFIPIELDTLQQATLNKALDFLKEANFEMPYEVATVSFLENDDTLGMADRTNMRILLSDKSIDLGTFTTVSTLIEEYAHLKSGKNDCTRPFQTYLIELMIRQLEKNTSYLL